MSNKKEPDDKYKTGMYLFEFTGMTIPPKGLVLEPTFVHKMGVTPRTKIILTAEELRGVIKSQRDPKAMSEMYDKGVTLEKIAELFSLSRGKTAYSIDKYRTDNNLPSRGIMSRMHTTKIANKKDHIMTLHLEGKTNPQIAERLQLGVSTVQKVVYANKVR